MSVRTAAEANADGKRRHPRAFYRRTVQTARFLKVVPAVFKEAFIIPLLKKPDLDSADPRSWAYRPISNLSVHALEAVRTFVARQLIEIDNIAAANLQPDRHLASDLSTP